MSDVGWTALRELFLANYDDLARRLARRLRSPELAREALQDTFLRLERGGEIGPISYPLEYLLRIATNLARDRLRAERRLATAFEIDAALDIADDAPDPARVAEANSEMAALIRALAGLPARRRAIFLAAWRENLPHGVIAERFGLSQRKINMELELAREYCARALKQLAKK